MWWDIAAEARADFQHWHSHEHFPERLGVPGFQRATRWMSASGGDGVFVMYELDTHEVLSSPDYLARLNAPSPWSIQMMPLHRNMIRAQCHVLATCGGAVGQCMLTLRLSAMQGRVEDLTAGLTRLIEECAARPGIVGAHLLRHESPRIPQTAEQKVRQAPDQVADFVLVVCGYDNEALSALRQDRLSAAALADFGAAPEIESGLYRVAHSATPCDVRQ